GLFHPLSDKTNFHLSLFAPFPGVSFYNPSHMNKHHFLIMKKYSFLKIVDINPFPDRYTWRLKMPQTRLLTKLDAVFHLSALLLFQASHTPVDPLRKRKDTVIPHKLY